MNLISNVMILLRIIGQKGGVLWTAYLQGD